MPWRWRVGSCLWLIWIAQWMAARVYIDSQQHKQQRDEDNTPARARLAGISKRAFAFSPQKGLSLSLPHVIQGGMKTRPENGSCIWDVFTSQGNIPALPRVVGNRTTDRRQHPSTAFNARQPSCLRVREYRKKRFSYYFCLYSILAFFWRNVNW